MLRGLNAGRLMVPGLFRVIVDEADSVLIDEAVTPLIISNSPDDEANATLYRAAHALAEMMEQYKDFTIDWTIRKFEIGYWLRTSAIGHGYATETVQLLTRLAFEVDAVDRVEIHMDPANAASAAIPKKCGYRHDATLRRRSAAPGGEPRDTMIWSIFADELAASPAAKAEVEAYDAAGRRVL